MIVYLDENKWIQIARVWHGKDSSPAVSRIAKLAEAGAFQLPLSAAHYIETTRTSNAERRQRLGLVMWQLSRGQTLRSQKSILVHEAEVALSHEFPNVQPKPFELVGTGVTHAFGMEYRAQLPPVARPIIERAILTGESVLGMRPPPFSNEQQRLAFQQHLAGFRGILEKNLTPDRWDDALHAASLVEVLDPIHEAAALHKVSPEMLLALGAQRLTRLVDAMPSRRVDIHLHKQVLKNRAYVPKTHDLEDWGALGVAVVYCDVVVCEKHFKDLVGRDAFRRRRSSCKICWSFYHFSKRQTPNKSLKLSP